MSEVDKEAPKRRRRSRRGRRRKPREADRVVTAADGDSANARAPSETAATSDSSDRRSDDRGAGSTSRGDRAGATQPERSGKRRRRRGSRGSRRGGLQRGSAETLQGRSPESGRERASSQGDGRPAAGPGKAAVEWSGDSQNQSNSSPTDGDGRKVGVGTGVVGDVVASEVGAPIFGGQGEDSEEERNTKWWVDLGDADEPRAPTTVTEVVPVGQKFYRAARDFEQEAARKRLTDNNLKLLIEANPAEGEWGYVQLADVQFPAKDAERIRDSVELPSYARGALIDSGKSIRLLVTGTPIGERILELTLAREPSFDCWVQDEWVKEVVFKDRKRALRGFRELIEHYLSPEGIEVWEQMRARA